MKTLPAVKYYNFFSQAIEWDTKMLDLMIFENKV